MKASPDIPANHDAHGARKPNPRAPASENAARNVIRRKVEIHLEVRAYARAWCSSSSFLWRCPSRGLRTGFSRTLSLSWAGSCIRGPGEIRLVAAAPLGGGDGV